MCYLKNKFDGCASCKNISPLENKSLRRLVPVGRVLKHLIVLLNWLMIMVIMMLMTMMIKTINDHDVDGVDDDDHDVDDHDDQDDQ